MLMVSILPGYLSGWTLVFGIGVIVVIALLPKPPAA